MTAVRKNMDPRAPTMPGRSTSELHRPQKHVLRGWDKRTAPLVNERLLNCGECRVHDGFLELSYDEVEPTVLEVLGIDGGERGVMESEGEGVRYRYDCGLDTGDELVREQTQQQQLQQPNLFGSFIAREHFFLSQAIRTGTFPVQVSHRVCDGRWMTTSPRIGGNVRDKCSKTCAPTLS